MFGMKRDPRMPVAPTPSLLPGGNNASAAIEDGYRAICEWWGVCLPDVSDDLKAYIIGISLGLGTLFDDDRSAELAWLNARRPWSTWDGRFEMTSYMELIQSGNVSDILYVVGVLNDERGLR